MIQSIEWMRIDFSSSQRLTRLYVQSLTLPHLVRILWASSIPLQTLEGEESVCYGGLGYVLLRLRHPHVVVWQ